MSVHTSALTHTNTHTHTHTHTNAGHPCIQVKITEVPAYVLIFRCCKRHLLAQYKTCTCLSKNLYPSLTNPSISFILIQTAPGVSLLDLLQAPKWSDGSKSNTAMSSLESIQSEIHLAPSSRRGKQKNIRYWPPWKHGIKTSSKDPSTMCQEKSSQMRSSQLSIETDNYSSSDSDSSSTSFESFDECTDLPQSREPNDVEMNNSEVLDLEENGNPSEEGKEVTQESDCLPGSTEYHTCRGSVVGTKFGSHAADIFIDGCPRESCVNDLPHGSIKEEPCENAVKKIIVPNGLNVTHDGHVYIEFLEGKYGEDWVKTEIKHEESDNQ